MPFFFFEDSGIFFLKKPGLLCFFRREHVFLSILASKSVEVVVGFKICGHDRPLATSCSCHAVEIYFVSHS